jgi:hypothetical protein
MQNSSGISCHFQTPLPPMAGDGRILNQAYQIKLGVSYLINAGRPISLNSPDLSAFFYFLSRFFVYGDGQHQNRALLPISLYQDYVNNLK